GRRHARVLDSGRVGGVSRTRSSRDREAGASRTHPRPQGAKRVAVSFGRDHAVARTRNAGILRGGAANRRTRPARVSRGHALSGALGESIIAFGRTLSGIPFGAPKRQLSDLFFLVLCRDARTHLHVLARLGRIIQLPGFLDELRSAEDSGTAYSAICSADERLGADPT